MAGKRRRAHRKPSATGVIRPARRRAAKAGKVVLRQEMTAAVAFAAIARACLEHFLRNEARILEQHDTEALHQARVALRRLRSALSIHRAMLSGRRYDGVVRELRWLAAELGGARDLDVLLERAGPGPLAERLAGARAEAYASVEATLRSRRARHLMTDLAEWITAGAWRTDPEHADLRDFPVRAFAAGALDRFRKRVNKRGRNLAKLGDEARHKLRKSAKKLRYGAEFFGGLYPGKPRRKRFLAALEALQDELGALNDLRVADELLVRLGLTGDREARRLLCSDGKPELLAAAARRHARLLDIKPFWR